MVSWVIWDTSSLVRPICPDSLVDILAWIDPLLLTSSPYIWCSAWHFTEPLDSTLILSHQWSSTQMLADSTGKKASITGVQFIPAELELHIARFKSIYTALTLSVLLPLRISPKQLVEENDVLYLNCASFLWTLLASEISVRQSVAAARNKMKSHLKAVWWIIIQERNRREFRMI